MNAARTGFALSGMFLFCCKAIALPLTITPAQGTDFPLSVNKGQPVTAIFTVSNNSTYTLTGLTVENIPAHVTQVTTDPVYPDLCGSSFSLLPGTSCSLEFMIDSAVTNASNTSICIPGTPKTCQGFKFDLPSSGWSLIGSPIIGPVNGYIELLLTNGSTVYAAGDANDQLSSLWSFKNGVWTNIFHGAPLTTGSGSVFQAMAFTDATHGYLSGHNSAWGTVYSVDTSTYPATVVDLLFKDHTVTTQGQTEYPYEVDAMVYSPSNTTLYVGGEANTDNLNNYGVVYSLQGSTWTNLGITNAIFVDSLAIAGDYLYAAVIGQGVNFAEVFAYPLSGCGWIDTYLPNSVVEIHSLIADSKGVLYAGGYDNNGGTVWKYQQGEWISLGFQGGSEIKALSIDDQGVLYAAGVDNNFGGGVWTYKNGLWQSINPGSSSFVNAIALMSGSVFTAGQSLISAQCVWKR